MVKEFYGTGAKLNRQHREILKWLENNKKFRNCYVFLEFQPQGFGKRDIDMLILLPDRIHSLELKGGSFTDISANGTWKLWDPRKNKEVIYGKKIKGIPENPYNQATDASEKFKNWIRRNINKMNVSSRLKTFIKSNDFKVYPAVYISQTNLLEPSNTETEKWCFLAKGVESLEICLDRNWMTYSKAPVKMDDEFIESLALELKLISLKPSRPGRDNQTLIKILQYMIDNSPKWNNEDQINHDVFQSGEKRISSVRYAVIRGKKEGLLFFGENYYESSPLLTVFYQNNYSIQHIYEIWIKIKFLQNFQVKDPEIFDIYTKHRVLQELNVQSNSLQTKIYELSGLIPDSLQIFSFDKIIRYQEEIEPKFFRQEGCLWTDIINEYIIPFLDSESLDLIVSILDELSEGKKILIHGGPSTGKTTLVRLIGLSLIKQNTPVILVNPSELDKEAMNAILQFEKQNNNSTINELVVIIENVHLATASEASNIKRFLRPYQRIKFLFTSRKGEISILKENLLEIFQEEKKGIIFDLNSESDLNLRYHSIIENILNKSVPNLDKKEQGELITQIKNRTKKNPLLIKYEIEAIIDILNANKSIDLLKNTNEIEKQANQKLTDRVEILTNNIENETDLSTQAIRKTLYLLYSFCYLEIPIRSEYIAKISSLDRDLVQKILIFLETRGDILIDQSDQLILHPVYAHKIITILPNFSKDWTNVEDQISQDLEKIEGNTIFEKIQQKIFELDPSLKADWSPTEETPYEIQIDYETITIENLVKYANDLYVDDFVQILMQNITWKYSWSSQKWWKLWDTLGINQILSMLEEADSLQGSIQLLNEIFQSKWPEFSHLLTLIQPQFFFQFEDLRFSEFSSRVMKYLKEWNYPGSLLIEIEYILSYFMSNDFREGMYLDRISSQTFNHIDKLNHQAILKELISNPKLNIRGFLQFLNINSINLKLESQLRLKILANILEDALKTFSISHFCTVLENISSNEFQTNTNIKTIIQNWDIDSIHSGFLQLDASWFRYFLSLIEKWGEDRVMQLIEKFSISDISTILKNPLSDEDWDPLPQLLVQLKAVHWTQLSEFVDFLGYNYFINIIIQKGEKYHYYGTFLLQFLLTLEWNQKMEFVNNFDFPTWAKNQEFRMIEGIIPDLIQLEIPNLKLIIKKVFDKEFHKDWLYTDMEKIIKLCEDQKIDWKEWIDLNHINSLITENLHRGLEFIEFLEERGWKIPRDLENMIEQVSSDRDQTYLKRLSQLEKARYFYFNKKDKSKSVKIFIEVVQDLKNAKNFSELQRMLSYLNNISPKDQKTIISMLSPDIVSNVSIKNYSILSKTMSILHQLKKLNYPNIHKITTLFFKNTILQFEKEFWSQIKILSFIDGDYLKIYNILWEMENYEKLSRLPEVFDSCIISQQSKILEQIIASNLSNPFLWQLYLVKFKKTEFTRDEDFQVAMQQIFSKIQKLNSFSILISEFPKRKEYVVQAFFSLDSNLVKEIFLKTSIQNILKFFQTLNQNNFDLFLVQACEILTEEEWTTHFLQKNNQYSSILKFWLKEIYPNLIYEHEGVKSSYFEKFS